MCQRIECQECGKPSFIGCGRHVESVLAGVPPSARCRGHAARGAPAVPAGTRTVLRKLIDFVSGADRRGRS